MGLLICQIVIKQWDKSQLTHSHVTARAALPDRYTILAKPDLKLSNKDCIIDQHGDDLSTSVYKDGRIKTIKPSDRQIRFDRFEISADRDREVLWYVTKDKSPEMIASFDQGWIQCRYNWRYGVEESTQFYWLYEELILNAVIMEDIDADYFFKSEPQIIFEDG